MKRACLPLLCSLMTGCSPHEEANLARAVLEKAHADQIECELPERVAIITDETHMPVVQFCKGYMDSEALKTIIDISKRDGSVFRIDHTANVEFRDERKRPADFAAYDYCTFSANLEICVVMYLPSSTRSKLFVIAAQRR